MSRVYNSSNPYMDGMLLAVVHINHHPKLK